MSRKPNRYFHLGCCDFSVVDVPSATFDHVLAYYDRLRAYVQHEDGLINARMTWSLTIHGFLFAIYGLLLSKIADLFVSLSQSHPASTLLETAISWLFVFQIPITAFGGAVAFQSLRTIKAAHKAIQRVHSIARSSRALGAAPLRRKAAAAIARGRQMVTPDSLQDIQVGSILLVDPIQEEDEDSDREEIVAVTSLAPPAFEAVFAKEHPSGAELWGIGPALLPGIVGGGDPRNTLHANSYYEAFPMLALGAWIFLGLASLVLAFWSFRYGVAFFWFMGLVPDAPG